MEIRYKSDLYASYIQIAIPQHINRKQYVFQMLEENSIKGVLPVKQRMEEGQPYLYLDITAKNSLLQEYQDREMELEDMTFILQQLVLVYDELRNYLLPDKFLLLAPDFIYLDTENGSLSVALLGWEPEEGREFYRLAEFFLEKMNPRDEHGINAAYLLYKKQSQQAFSLYQFLPVIEKENILKRQKKKEEPSAIKERNEDYFASIQISEEGKEEMKQENLQLTGKKKGKKRGKLAEFFGRLFGRKKQEALCEEGIKLTEDQDIMKQEGYDYSQETVFFEDSGRDIPTLQWKEKGRIKKAELSQLPLTIGKIRQEVSVVMEDSSVSRVHCRFIEQENGIGIMDMNSTNGTYLNGMRLKPGEIMGIIKNDEILIGKVRVLVV